MRHHSAPSYRPSSAVTAPPVLLAIRNAREEIVAGCGNALLEVRTLDGLSCDISAGDLLLLTGGVASGATSLLAALRGWMSRARGERRVSPGVQLRRATIPLDAAEAIVAGWRDAERAGLAEEAHVARVMGASPAVKQRAPVVYLLRARARISGHGGSGAITPASWRMWAAALQQRGGAVVIAQPPGQRDLGAAACGERAPRDGPAVPGTNEKRAASCGALPEVMSRYSSEAMVVREAELEHRSRIRALTLHAGRIVSVQELEQAWGQ